MPLSSARRSLPAPSSPRWRLPSQLPSRVSALFLPSSRARSLWSDWSKAAPLCTGVLGRPFWSRAGKLHFSRRGSGKGEEAGPPPPHLPQPPRGQLHSRPAPKYLAKSSPGLRDDPTSRPIDALPRPCRRAALPAQPPQPPPPPSTPQGRNHPGPGRHAPRSCPVRPPDPWPASWAPRPAEGGDPAAAPSARTTASPCPPTPSRPQGHVPVGSIPPPLRECEKAAAWEARREERPPSRPGPRVSMATPSASERACPQLLRRTRP